MSTAAVVAVVVVLIVVAAVVAAVTLRSGRTGFAGPGGMRLKHRFGPEYERALAHHDGDEKATRRELGERVKRYGRLQLRPVAAEDRQRLQAGWDAAQARFVDRPADAVADADRLIGQLAAERGFPGPDSPDHTDALSVHYPHQLQGYRRARDLIARTGGDGSGSDGPGVGTTGTEELRQGLVAARELFEELLRDGGPAGGAASEERAAIAPSRTRTAASMATPATPAASESADDTASRGALGETARAGGSGADQEAPGGDGQDGQDGHDEHRRSALGHRFAGLTGGGSRKDTSGR